MIHVTDIDKATQSLSPGAQLTTADGVTATLGKDKVWRDQYGDDAQLYQGEDGKLHSYKRDTL
jgi:hypothetical protein